MVLRHVGQRAVAVEGHDAVAIHVVLLPHALREQIGAHEHVAKELHLAAVHVEQRRLRPHHERLLADAGCERAVVMMDHRHAERVALHVDRVAGRRDVAVQQAHHELLVARARALHAQEVLALLELAAIEHRHAHRAARRRHDCVASGDHLVEVAIHRVQHRKAARAVVVDEDRALQVVELAVMQHHARTRIAGRIEHDGRRRLAVHVAVFDAGHERLDDAALRRLDFECDLAARDVHAGDFAAMRAQREHVAKRAAVDDDARRSVAVADHHRVHVHERTRLARDRRQRPFERDHRRDHRVHLDLIDEGAEAGDVRRFCRRQLRNRQRAVGEADRLVERQHRIAHRAVRRVVGHVGHESARRAGLRNGCGKERSSSEREEHRAEKPAGRLTGQDAEA